MWGDFILGLALAGQAPDEACLRLVTDLAQGASMTAAAVVAAPCADDQAPTPLRVRGGNDDLYASTPLKAGQVIRGVVGIAPPAVAPGQSLMVSTRVGPVTIERKVVALQAARPGGDFFVRTEDGKVFTASMPQEAR